MILLPCAHIRIYKVLTGLALAAKNHFLRFRHQQLVFRNPLLQRF